MIVGEGFNVLDADFSPDLRRFLLTEQVRCVKLKTLKVRIC